MERQKTFERLVQALGDAMNLPDVEISENTKLVDDLEADSVDFATILMELEEVFEIEIPDNTGEKISDATLGQITDFILKLKHEA
ncbi:phosphopantetheine-binding protein [Catenovulum sediminis]|uniref:Phosphopantetheine-binding protein n=1 Tax=Catenovulum sediminis TaxID=1740262 RepID=A0ABV1RG78_9ALTE